MSWTAFTDGGSRGNPGPAGAGVLIQDEAGKTVFAGGFWLGRMTNNQAEYRGLLAALDLLARAGAPAIRILTDSELMVRQITGAYRVKSPLLQPLFTEARERFERFEQWRIEHVPRTQNKQADKLANQAMSAGADVVRTDRLGLVQPSQRVSAPPGKAVPAAADGSVEVVVMRAPARGACGGGVRAGQSFVFTDVTPAGLCVEACSAVIEAVLALREAGAKPDAFPSALTPRCQKAGCGAVFEVRFARGRA